MSIKIDLTGKKVLRLSLKMLPFQTMFNGQKKEEYRKPSKWIESRLFDKLGHKRSYDYIFFTQGYGNNRPYFIAEFEDFLKYNGRDAIITFKNGLMVSVEHGDYIITIGNILEVGNYGSNNKQ